MNIVDDDIGVLEIIWQYIIVVNGSIPYIVVTSYDSVSKKLL